MLTYIILTLILWLCIVYLNVLIRWLKLRHYQSQFPSMFSIPYLSIWIKGINQLLEDHFLLLVIEVKYCIFTYCSYKFDIWLSLEKKVSCKKLYLIQRMRYEEKTSDLLSFLQMRLLCQFLSYKLQITFILQFTPCSTMIQRDFTIAHCTIVVAVWVLKFSLGLKNSEIYWKNWWVSLFWKIFSQVIYQLFYPE